MTSRTRTSLCPCPFVMQSGFKNCFLWSMQYIYYNISSFSFSLCFLQPQNVVHARRTVGIRTHSMLQGIAIHLFRGHRWLPIRFIPCFKKLHRNDQSVFKKCLCHLLLQGNYLIESQQSTDKFHGAQKAKTFTYKSMLQISSAKTE